MIFIIILFSIVEGKKHKNRVSGNTQIWKNRKHNYKNDDADYHDKDWLKIRPKLDTLAKSRAYIHAKHLNKNRINNVLLNSILYQYGIAGSMDINDPIGLAFIKSHQKEGSLKNHAKSRNKDNKL